MVSRVCNPGTSRPLAQAVGDVEMCSDSEQKTASLLFPVTGPADSLPQDHWAPSSRKKKTKTTTSLEQPLDSPEMNATVFFQILASLC